MSDDLRDAIFDLVIERTTASINEAEALADAVLAMPEIVDMLALRRRVDDVLSYIVDCYLGDIPVRPEWIEKMLRA